MGNVFSAQNVTSYIIYELNEVHTFINQNSIQYLLAQIEGVWQKVFGHNVFREVTHNLSEGFFVKEVFDSYSEHGNDHIDVPATEWYLKFGEFQLVQRTYAVPAFTALEEKVVQAVLNRYRQKLLKRAS